MTLPSPEVMQTYASILRKQRRDKDGLAPPGEIALAAAEALEFVARNVNADSGIAAQLAGALTENGRLRVALSHIKDNPASAVVLATEALTPKHHSFEAVSLSTDKPQSGNI